MLEHFELKRFGFLLPLLLLVLFATVYNIWYLKLFTRWWYADDPLQIHLVSVIANPAEIFVDPSRLHNWGTGNALVPFQLLSYWIDAHLFGADPFPAYVHNFLAFLAATSLLYLVLLRCTGRKSVAFSATLVWMLLPSTLAVHQYISTRHYMEGLLFALALALTVLRTHAQDNQTGWELLAIGCLGLISMLCKEVYATTVPTFLALVGLWQRRYRLVWIGIGLAAVYGAYRVTFLGTHLTYTMELVGPREYLSFLAHLPYMFTATPIGYVIYAGMALLIGLTFRRSGRAAVWPLVLFASLVATALLAVYPVTWAVQLVYKVPGTWYRVPFLINTLIVICGAWMLSRSLGRFTGAVVFGLVLFLVLPGTEMTRLQWLAITSKAEMEGKFYIENPDKLLYSEEEASWFIYGVHKLYNVPDEHYINKYFTTDPLAQRMIRKYDTIWHYELGEYVADDRLFQIIKIDNLRSCTPGAPCVSQ